MKKLIALTGASGSGKSTVAEYLSQLEPSSMERKREHIPFARIKFSQTLKKMLLQIPGITEEMTEGRLKETPQEIFGGQTPRQVMQTLGTEWGRELVSKNIWLDSWERSIEDYSYVVAEDLRYVNEAELVKRLGGEIWRVKRPNYLNSGHVSETEQTDIEADVIIHNNGSIENLHLNVRAILSPWNGEDVEPKPWHTQKVRLK